MAFWCWRSSTCCIPASWTTSLTGDHSFAAFSPYFDGKETDGTYNHRGKGKTYVWTSTGTSQLPSVLSIYGAPPLYTITYFSLKYREHANSINFCCRCVCVCVCECGCVGVCVYVLLLHTCLCKHLPASDNHGFLCPWLLHNKPLQVHQVAVKHLCFISECHHCHLRHQPTAQQSSGCIQELEKMTASSPEPEWLCTCKCQKEDSYYHHHHHHFQNGWSSVTVCYFLEMPFVAGFAVRYSLNFILTTHVNANSWYVKWLCVLQRWWG